MSSERVEPCPLFRTTGEGYEEVISRTEDGEVRTLPHHRLLAYAWGELESPLFDRDPREVHHETKLRWLNTERNLTALTPREHAERDPARAQITTPWDRRGEI